MFYNNASDQFGVLFSYMSITQSMSVITIARPKGGFSSIRLILGHLLTGYDFG